MTELHVSDAIRYVGVDDTTIDLFESQYPVPNGVSYNSYVILDEKVAVMDTVDRRAAPDWLERLAAELGTTQSDRRRTMLSNGGANFFIQSSPIHFRINVCLSNHYFSILWSNPSCPVE